MDDVLDSLGVNDLFTLVRKNLNQGSGVYTEPTPKLLLSKANGEPCKEQAPHYDYAVL
jgi:hypothetical protein